MNAVHVAIFGGKRGFTVTVLGHAACRRWLAASALILSLLTLGVVGWLSWKSMVAARQAEHAFATLRVLASQTRRQPSRLDDVSASAEEVRAWNHVVRQLNIPWQALLDSLERTGTNDVALVALEAEPSSGSVRLLSEAITFDALLAYAQQFEANPVFSASVLLKHETSELDSIHPQRLSFALTPAARRRETPSLEGSQ